MGFLLSAAFDTPVKLTIEIIRAAINDVIFFIITPSLLILIMKVCS
jgi:hypothetical protein